MKFSHQNIGCWVQLRQGDGSRVLLLLKELMELEMRGFPEGPSLPAGQ